MRKKKSGGWEGRGATEKAVERVSTQQSQGHAEATWFLVFFFELKKKNKVTFILCVCVFYSFLVGKEGYFARILDVIWCKGGCMNICVFVSCMALKEPPICLQL